MSRHRLNVFVYGTLKQGERNHDRFCQGVLNIREATAHGWLYDLPFGFPALVVPEETILAIGTEDYVGDADRQRSTPLRSSSWDTVAHGELITFDDPRTRLPALDSLEGFRPGEPGLYRRVLIPVQANGQTTPAWAYTVERPSGEHLPDGRWPLRF